MEIVRIEKYDEGNGKTSYIAYYSAGIGVAHLTKKEEEQTAKVFEMIVSKYKE